VSHVGKLVRFVDVTKDIVYIIVHGMNGVKVIFSQFFLLSSASEEGYKVTKEISVP